MADGPFNLRRKYLDPVRVFVGLCEVPKMVERTDERRAGRLDGMGVGRGAILYGC